MTLIPTTKAQRSAMKRLFDRRALFPGGRAADQIAQEHGWTFRVHYDDAERPDRVTDMYWEHPDNDTTYTDSQDLVLRLKLAEPMTYREFRRSVYQSHMGCLITTWQGLTIGIETDGYTHS